jgi:hypothetical protein
MSLKNQDGSILASKSYYKFLQKLTLQEKLMNHAGSVKAIETHSHFFCLAILTVKQQECLDLLCRAEFFYSKVPEKNRNALLYLKYCTTKIAEDIF